MSDLITLGAGRLEAVINPDGAYIESLRQTEGQDLLLPRGEYETIDGPKRRGTHICLPNFGPAPDETRLAQHGFARTSRWEVTGSGADRVQLLLDVPTEGRAGVPIDYYGLRSYLVYSLFDFQEEGSGLSIQLQVQNRGNTPMRVAPGLHPYFPVPDGVKDIRIHQKMHNKTRDERTMLDQLAEANHKSILHAGATIHAAIGSSALTIYSSKNMLHLTTWTDAPETYVCIEPTNAGPSFEKPLTANETLTPGQTRYYTSIFTWNLKD